MYKLAGLITECTKLFRISETEIEDMLYDFLQNKIKNKDLATTTKFLSFKSKAKLADIQRIREEFEMVEKEFEINSKKLMDLQEKLNVASQKNQALLDEKTQIEVRLAELTKSNKQLDYDNQMSFAKVNSQKSNIKLIHKILIVFSILGMLLAIIFSIFNK